MMGRAMPSRRAFLKLLIPVVTLLVCFAVLEVAVRLMLRCDADGECRFRFTRLKPYRVPVQRAERDIAAYLQSEKSAMMYDPQLGWNQRPSVAEHNAAGFITSRPEVAIERPADRLRIALFGDSFTQGSFEKGWWRVLEDRLNAAGHRAEVLNFGVAGYGMDQAFLRWRKDGAPYRAHLVIFGFFSDDCYRNLNLLRLLRDPDSGIPFMKPRFVREGDRLQLVNSPTPAPEQVAEILREFPSWPLAGHEGFFRPGDFAMKWWRHSRFLALGEAKLTLARAAATEEDFFRIDGEAAQVALGIIRQFGREVTTAGSEFCVVHLPAQGDMEALRKAGRLPYDELYKVLRSELTVIQPEQEQLALTHGKDIGSFFRNGHYKPELNAVVGEVVARFVGERYSRAGSGARP